MTIADLRCDLCGTTLVGSAMVDETDPRAAVRLYLHPGDPLHRDDQPLVCRSCYEDLRRQIGDPRTDVCAVCGSPVTYEASLHVLEMTGVIGEAPEWQFCRQDAVALLNRFRFIEPKMEPADLALKEDFGAS